MALGSVKSNIGHLKAAAGAAGLLKTAFALRDKVLSPSLNFERPNPNLDWSASPFAVNTEARDWEVADGATRVAGVSAFGFGGTNFHVVMEEHVPGHLTTNGHRTSIAVPAEIPPAQVGRSRRRAARSCWARPTRPALANELAGRRWPRRRQGRHLDPAPPSAAALRAPERIAIDYADGPDLVAKAEVRCARCSRARRRSGRRCACARHPSRQWRARARSRSSTPARARSTRACSVTCAPCEPVVADLFDEADDIMSPLLEGRKLSDIIFKDADAEEQLRRTEITQPAVLTVDIALTRLLGEYGIAPGHGHGPLARRVRRAGGGRSLTFEPRWRP